MTTTTNYGFNLPAGTDPASITPLNQNTEMMDRYLKANINAIAEDYDESATYNTGDLAVHDNGLYVCNDDGVTGTWDSTKWDTTTVGENLGGGDIDIDVIGEGSGSIVTFNDGSGLPLKSLTAEINAVQTGSGTPSPENPRPIEGFDEVDIEVNDGDEIEQHTVIELPTTIYGGEVDVVGGGMKDRKVHLKLNGTESWTLRSQSNVNPRRFTMDISSLGAESLPSSGNTSSHFEYIMSAATSDAFGIFRNSDTLLVLPDSQSMFADATALNDWLAQQDANGTPVEFVLKLATPTTTTITPVSIPTLEGTNNISADSGDISLEYIKGGDFTEAVTAICEVLKKNDILTEYELYDYIQSDGTQVIDTGRQVVQGQTIEVVFEGSDSQSAYAWIFGGITSSDYYGFQFPNHYTIYWYNGGTSASRQESFSSNTLVRKEITFNSSIASNIHIFGLLDGSTYTNKGKFKVYSFNINGDYFMPAKRKSDGVFGLYDVANKTFLTDVAGGNAFTGGSPTGIEV